MTISRSVNWSLAPSGAQRWRFGPPESFVVVLALFVAAYAVIPYVVRSFREPSDQQIGDWLINFQGGIVRRGLLGEILIRSGLESSGVTASILVLQVGAYLTVVFAVIFLYMRRRRSWAWFALALSPAFVAFAALQPSAGFRKEVLGLAAVGVAAMAGHMCSPRRASALWAASTLVYCVAVVAHEANLIAGAALLWLLIRDRPRISSRPFVIVIVATGSAFTILSLILSLRYPGSASTTGGICNGLVSVGYDRQICGGAIKAVGIPLGDIANYLWSDLYPMYWWYLAFLILALLPIAATGFVRSHLNFTVVVLMTVLPLFAISIDYGRWISLVASILSLLALSVPEAMKEWRIPLAPIVSVIYVITWSPTLVEYPLRQTSWVTLVVDSFRGSTGM